MNKSNNIYKKIENVIKLIMVSTFFMPWVVTDVGGVIKKFHFIGWLVGGRTGSSEEIIYYVINHSDSIFLKLYRLCISWVQLLFILERYVMSYLKKKT